jgi:hypothetical protein
LSTCPRWATHLAHPGIPPKAPGAEPHRGLACVGCYPLYFSCASYLIHAGCMYSPLEKHQLSAETSRQASWVWHMSKAGPKTVESLRGAAFNVL